MSDQSASDHFRKAFLRAQIIDSQMVRQRRLNIAIAALFVSSAMLIPITITLLKGKLFTTQRTDTELAVERDRLRTEVSHLRSELAKLKKDTLDTRSAITNATNNSAEALIVRVAASELTMRDQAARLERLEGALSTDPEKALSLPLLRKDLEVQDERFERETSAIRSEIDKVDRLASTLLFSMISALFAVLAASIGLIFRYVLPGRNNVAAKPDEE